jgi:integrase
MPVSIVGRLNVAFGSKKLGELRASDVSAYAARALGRLSAASVSRDLSILHSILAWAVVNELVERNVADGVPHPKAVQRKGVALKPADVQLLARSFEDEQARVAFLTFVLTGLRRAELQALRWRDVDLIENVLRVADSKTETGERAVAISPTLAEELWQHRRRSAYDGDGERAFVHPQRGTVYRYEAYKAALERAFAKAGLECGAPAAVPRPSRHGDHERRDRGRAPSRADDEGGPCVDGGDEALPASRWRRLPRRGRGA